jgi:hypothetical protein
MTYNVGDSVVVHGWIDGNSFNDEIGIILKVRSLGTEAYEVEFPHRSNLHNGTSTDWTIRNRYYVKHERMVLAKKAQKKKSGFAQFISRVDNV